MLLLLMMQLEKLGFIAFDKNMMFLTLLRNGNILIQVDIGGHPPFPMGSKPFSYNFGNLLFLVVFWVLKLLKPF
jgi:hypothetical protein